MNAENPADTVIEAVALAISKHRHGSQEVWDEDRRLARALYDAGFLADPADRDERRNEAYRAQLARADRAEAEVADLRQKWLTFTSALGFGNNRTEPAAELSEMIDPIERAFSDARDHQECAVICELCGDPLAAKTCDECHGSGCLPNSRLAYLECGTCAGVGKVHEGCVEKSYAELVAEVAELRAELRVTTNERDRSRVYGRELRAMIDRVRALADEWTNDLKSYPNRAVEVRRDDLRAALDGSGQQ